MFSIFKKKPTGAGGAEKSIYQYILEHIGRDGSVPVDFSLPDQQGDNQIRFAAGALDGMGIYHMAGGDVSAAVEEFMPILEAAVSQSGSDAERSARDLINANRVLRLIDPLSEKLRSGQTNITPQNLLATAYRWATESADVELTKLGLALLGLLNIENDKKCRKVILTLGKCDEFTLYSLVAVSGWSDGGKLTFELARTTHGWGKIHAVDRLAPETQEEKDWILRHGCANGVVNAYLGLPCAEKGDMITALKRADLDRELFWGISIIFQALFDEGPTAGISAYEHAAEAIRLYLRHAQRLCDSAAILSVILTIKEHYENAGQSAPDEIVAQCNTIIERDGWRKVVANEIDSGDCAKFYPAWSVANKLGLDIEEPLFRYIEKNPLKNGYYVSSLLKNPDYRDRIISLYEKELPLDKIASGMGDRMGLGKGYEPHRCLGFIIQALQPHPMLGIRFVKVGLASPVVNNRNGACATMEAWKSSLNQPVQQFLPDVAAQLDGLIEEEVDEDLRERYKVILAHNRNENFPTEQE